MSSYSPLEKQWIRPRTAVERWVASWAPSDQEIRAAWMAEAKRQQHRAAKKRQELTHDKRIVSTNWWWLPTTQQGKDKYIEKLWAERKVAKAGASQAGETDDEGDE